MQLVTDCSIKKTLRLIDPNFEHFILVYKN